MARSSAQCQPARSMITRAWAPGAMAWLSSSSISCMAAVDRGEDQGDAGVALWANGAEQVGGFMPEIAPATRPLPLLEPAAAGSAGLAHPGLVEEPDLEPLGVGL